MYRQISFCTKNVKRQKESIEKEHKIGLPNLRIL